MLTIYHCLPSVVCLACINVDLSAFFIRPFAITVNVSLYVLYHDGYNPDLRGRI